MLTPIYITQMLLSLLNVALIYVLAWQVVRHRTAGSGQQANVRAPTIAALLAALYLPFAIYPQIVLGETFYSTLLLLAFVVLGHWASHVSTTRASVFWLAVAGGLCGLATLTRGLTLGFLPLVALWVVWWQWARRQSHPQPLPARLAPLAFVLACLLTILPWTVYASRAYGGLVLVDTTGAFNLLLGARTAYDGGRSDAPTRNFVLALLNERLSDNERHTLLADACLYQRGDERLLAALARPASDITHAERQQLMTAEGLCLLTAKPGAFVAKSLTELVDLFQINYTGAERMTDGFALGWLPRWYVLALFVLDDTLYVVLLVLAVLGWALAWQRLPGRSFWMRPPLVTLVGLWWLYNLGTAPLLFAINRFRIPLLPFACIFAALLLVALWERNQQQGHHRLVIAPLALLVAAVLATVAITPYAYLQAPPAPWASYMGPYPSSFAVSQIAWRTRTTFLYEQQIIDALGRGDGFDRKLNLITARAPPRSRCWRRSIFAAGASWSTIRRSTIF
ncbi:MAG: hypothetical protein HC876_20170 [Chloroflexaceae bacterium]|nr:hypothetical protein [Chloroflexaceae bacterium]